jgi:hypothetical protein
MHILDTTIRRLEEHLAYVHSEIEEMNLVNKVYYASVIRDLEVESYSIEEALIILEKAREENKV